MIKRIAISFLSLSAAGFAGIVLQEGYTDKAVIPIPGDRPTYGLGSTFKEDGSPVQMTDTITPQKAIRLAVNDLGRKEKALRKCFGDSVLYQHEYDSYVDLSYSVGVGGVCNSSIPRKVLAKQYEAACNTILEFKKAAGKDCSIKANKCYGLWLRRIEINHLCLTGERK